METTATATEQVCLNYMAICERAIGTLQRRGVCEWVERDELISEGCLALSMAKPDAEALAVTIARRAMIDAIRKNERRERGRVEVRATAEGSDEPLDGDELDAAVYGKQKLQPANSHPDLWEAMKSLPARQYQAITLTYWAGMSDEAVAVEMGISSQAVDALLKKAQRNIAAGVGIAIPHTITNVRGKETLRTVLSGGTEEA